MKILVLQHVASEHPGEFRRFLAEDGHEWVPVELDAGERPPPLDGFDALWVMGGPMDAWEDDEHPWLVGEKALIRGKGAGWRSSASASAISFWPARWAASAARRMCRKSR